MISDYPEGNVEAQTGAFSNGFGSEKRFENAILKLLGDSLSVVGYFDHGRSVFQSGRDADGRGEILPGRCPGQGLAAFFTRFMITC